MQDAKITKNSPSAHHRTHLSGCISAPKACIHNRKNLLNNNISSTCPDNVVNFDTLRAEIGSGISAPPANFSEFWVLASLPHRRRSTEVNKILHDVWPSLGLVQYIYIFCGRVPHNEILPGAKFTRRPRLPCYCTTLEQWASAKLCGVVQRMELRSPLGSSQHFPYLLFG